MDSRLQTLNFVPLRNAVFCVNCETISDSPNGACAVCGSLSLIPLWRLLGGSGPESLKPEANGDHRGFRGAA